MVAVSRKKRNGQPPSSHETSVLSTGGIAKFAAETAMLAG
jgi:hypothetical protein